MKQARPKLAALRLLWPRATVSIPVRHPDWDTERAIRRPGAKYGTE
jgi:hypothetical protein